MANLSPFGSHEKSKTVSGGDVNTSHAIPVRSPTFVFYDFNREILIPHSEDLKIAEDGFLRPCVTVDLHAEEVALVLPVQLTLK